MNPYPTTAAISSPGFGPSASLTGRTYPLACPLPPRGNLLLPTCCLGDVDNTSLWSGHVLLSTTYKGNNTFSYLSFLPEAVEYLSSFLADEDEAGVPL